MTGGTILPSSTNSSTRISAIDKGFGGMEELEELSGLLVKSAVFMPWDGLAQAGERSLAVSRRCTAEVRG